MKVRSAFNITGMSTFPFGASTSYLRNVYYYNRSWLHLVTHVCLLLDWVSIHASSQHIDKQSVAVYRCTAIVEMSCHIKCDTNFSQCTNTNYW